MWMRQQPYRREEVECEKKCIEKKTRTEKSILAPLLGELFLFFCCAPLRTWHRHKLCIQWIHQARCRERKVYRCHFRWNSEDVSTSTWNNDSFVVEKTHGTEDNNIEGEWKKHTIEEDTKRKEKHSELESTDNGSFLNCSQTPSLVATLAPAEACKLCSGWRFVRQKK